MARWRRLVIPGFPLHITQRGHNRGATFIDDVDRARYLLDLRAASERAACPVHAYVLMSNHTHLLVTPPTRESASRMMQQLGRRYVRYFNDRHSRSGTLWESRFHSSPVDSTAYFLACSRYIDLNPVRAGMVTMPDEHPWSSYAYLAYRRHDAVVTPHGEYLALGTTPASRAAAYCALCEAGLSPRSVSLIRHATRGGGSIGTDEHHLLLTRTLGRAVTRGTRGGVRPRTAVGAASGMYARA